MQPVKPGFCVFLTLVAVIMSVCFVLGSAAEGGADSSCLCLEKVVDELYNPVEYLTVRRRNSLLSLVVEQRGVIRAFLGNKHERQEVFMDIRDRVTTSPAEGEERGEYVRLVYSLPTGLAWANKPCLQAC